MYTPKSPATIQWHTAADGWAVITDPTLIAALNNTNNTPWEHSVYGGLTIAPKWVVDAANVYLDNGGFAGIALYEYLDKISGERKTEPRHTF